MQHALIDNLSAGKARYLLRKLLSRTDTSEYRRGYRAGRLSVPHLHRVVTGEQNLFQRRTETDGTNSFVSIAIDASASMAGGERTLAAAKLACTLSSALSGCIGVRHDVLAWTTYRRWASGYEAEALYDPVDELVMGTAVIGSPEFDSSRERDKYLKEKAVLTYLKTDRDSTGDLCQLLGDGKHGEVFNGGATPAFSALYAAIRQARMRRGFGRKFVLFLTDGEIRNWAEERMMIKLCQEVERENIYVVGIGVQARVGHCFPPGASVNVMDLSDLGGKSMQRLVNRIIKSAA